MPPTLLPEAQTWAPPQVLLPAVRILAEHVRAADLKGGKLLDYVSAQVEHGPLGTGPCPYGG